MLLEVQLHELREALLEVEVGEVLDVLLDMLLHDRFGRIGGKGRWEWQAHKLIAKPNDGKLALLRELGPNSRRKDHTEHQDACDEAQEAIDREPPLSLRTGHRTVGIRD